ncbi:antibiotic biosynthesis monooxygenase [Pseudomonas nitroreducens]|uniref:antibiotic biosynthesis monooxygenase n=1 Tax=Pseudomonas nitroreducens TaxID=46680 RepID=UPI003CC82597
MRIVAVNTVEIDPAIGSMATLRAGLEALLDDLGHLSGCTAYRLTCGSDPGESWILTGYWDSLERMTAHFNLPCLARLFELVSERLISGLRFGTFLVSPLIESNGETAR